MATDHTFSPAADPEWRRIHDFPNYEVSDDGRVRGTRGILATHPNDEGYPRVRFQPGQRKRLVHLLVLEAFRGPRHSPRHFGAHMNGCRTDNRLSNLEWKLKEENEADKRLHGTQPRGGKTPKVGSARLQRIRAALAEGKSFSEIARAEQVHRSSVSRYARGIRRAS